MGNSFKTMLLLTLMAGLMMALGSALGGTQGMTIGLIFGLISAGGSYWFSDKLALASSGAVEASPAQYPEYHAIMQELCTTANLPMPRLYVTPNPQPNAFATGRNPNNAAVAITQGLMDRMGWAEIRGVLAHELAHIENRDILVGSVAAAIAMAVTFAARMAMWTGPRDRRNSSNAIVGIFLAMLAPIAATFIRSAISRTREFKADESAAILMGDGEPLARALERLGAASGIASRGVIEEQASHYIVNPLATKSNFGSLGGLSAMFSTHPPTEERIARLRSLKL